MGSTVMMDSSVALSSSKWSTESLSISDKCEQWQMALNKYYRHWTLSKRLTDEFEAQIEATDLNGIQLVHCQCQPCGGKRSKSEISLDNKLYLGVQITRKGREVFVINGQQHEIKSGELVVWLTEEPTEFQVLEKLDKVSLILPYDEFADFLPANMNLLGRKIDTQTGAGSILFNHINTLEQNMHFIDKDDYGYLRKTTLELLAMTLSKNVINSDSYSNQRHLKKIKKYIIDHIDYPELSPASIAKEHNISIRYLHLLFANESMTVSNFIKDYRLRMCAEELIRSSDKAFISSIAYKWGFNNPTHFSQTFRNKFLCSPREYREKNKHG